MKFLFQPLTPFYIRQDFGEDQVCFKQVGDGKIYRGKKTEENCQDKYGLEWKSIYQRMEGHNGIDLRADRWQPVYCAQDGTITEATQDSDGGIYVSVESFVEGKVWRHRYKHLMSFVLKLKVGKYIKTGQLLGWAGDTGRATGVHLHFDLKELDITGRILNYNNGYFGAVPPMQYFFSMSAIKISYFNLILEKAALALDKMTTILRNWS